jgi:uncharacterized protein (TIRG00374 family)
MASGKAGDGWKDRRGMFSQFKPSLKISLRILLGLGMLTFVIFQMKPHNLINRLSDLNYVPLALAVLAQVVAKFVWAVRWKEILGACGVYRKITDLLVFIFIGIFFNSFIPTNVGGDLVRGYYVARDKEGIFTSYVVVVLERALGLITLSALVASAAGTAILTGGFTLMLENFLETSLILGIVATVAGVIAFSWSGWIALIGKIKWLEKKYARQVEDLFKVFELFKRSDTPRLWIIANSAFLQIVAVLFHVACARTVGLQTPFILFFLVVPASVVAAMLPVSLNGLGIREGVLVGLLVACGAPLAESGAFAILALLVSTAFSLMGGIVYIAYRSPGKRNAPVNS